MLREVWELMRGIGKVLLGFGAVFGLLLVLLLAGMFVSALLEKPPTKELAELPGQWITKDGDEQLYGRLLLHVEGDSAWFGGRVYDDGRRDTTQMARTGLQVNADSLVFCYPSGSYSVRYLLHLDHDSLAIFDGSIVQAFRRYR